MALKGRGPLQAETEKFYPSLLAAAVLSVVVLAAKVYLDSCYNPGLGLPAASTPAPPANAVPSKGRRVNRDCSAHSGGGALR